MATAVHERTNNGAAQEHSPLRLRARTRRWRMGLLAAVLMVVGASLSVVALDRVDQRSPVLVAATALPAGHQIDAADVRLVEIAGAESIPTLGDIDQVVGATVTTPVADGAVLSEHVLGAEGEHLARDEAVVGVQLPVGRLPSSVRNGAQVTVVLTGEGADQSVPARVQNLESAADEAGGGEVFVDLVVEGTYAAQLARAAAADEVSLVHTAHGGDQG